MPILAPGTPWPGEIALTVPSEDYILRLSVIRSTGFTITEHSYDAQGELVPRALSVFTLQACAWMKSMASLTGEKLLLPALLLHRR